MRHGRLAVAAMFCSAALVGVASGAPRQPADVVRECFEAMRAGDLGRVRACYTERAWKLIVPSIPAMPDDGRTLPVRMHDAMGDVRDVRVDGIDREADGSAVVSATLIRGGAGDERVRVVLAETGAGWQIDYPAGTPAPFCLDDWTGIFWVWQSTFEATKGIEDPAAWYESGLAGLARARELAMDRPENVSALVAAGDAYFSWPKSDPKERYAVLRMRRETAARRSGDDPREQHPPMLDAVGWLSAGAAGELAYLKAYEGTGFEDGLPPVALAYAYYKRAQVVQAQSGRKHPALSASIIDSRPALMLENWGAEEWERGRASEIAAFGAHAPAGRTDMEATTAKTAWTAAGDAGQLRRAVAAYRLARGLMSDAVKEYERHTKAYGNTGTWEEHVARSRASAAEAAADADYLEAGLAAGAVRDRLTGSAAEGYARARVEWMRHSLIFFVEVPVLKNAGPADIMAKLLPRRSAAELQKMEPAQATAELDRELRSKREAIDSLDVDRLVKTYADVIVYCRTHQGEVGVSLDDIEETDAYVRRTDVRMKLLAAAAGAERR